MSKLSLYRFVLPLFILGFVFSCAAQKKHHKKDEKQTPFKENVSAYRFKYINTPAAEKQIDKIKTDSVIVPTNDITLILKKKIDTLNAANVNISKASGYRLLVYTGTSSQQAKEARALAYDVLANEKSYTEWVSPNFKVKLGDYTEKLEAYYFRNLILETFPNAVIVPDNVNIIR